MENVKELFETTEKTLQEIADITGRHITTVHRYTKNNYSKAYRLARKQLNYSKSKQGDKNPRFGKVREQSTTYKGDVADGNGYLMRVKPDWYTGRKGSKHVFTHQLVMCEHMGITEIQKGFCVHHIDGDKTNNNINNLMYMTIGAHMKLHSLERATTSRKA